MGKIAYRITEVLEKQQRLISLGAISFALVGGLLYSLILGNQLRYWDEKEYAAIAQNLVTRGIYSIDGVKPTAFRPPGYPLLIALIYSAKGNIIAVRLLNYIALALATWIIGRHFLSANQKTGASLSALLLFGYPVLFYTAGTLYPQTLQLLLMCLILFVGTKTTLNNGLFLFIGIIMAWAFLTNPTTILVIGVVGFYWLVRKVHLLKLLLVVGVFVLIVGTWSVRSSLAMRDVVLVSTNFGQNLLIGNSPNATPNGGTNTDISAYYLAAEGMSEIERNDFFKEQAIKWFRENPEDFMELYVLKVINYFTFRNELATPGVSSTLKDLLLFVTYYPLLLLGISRLLIYKKFPLSDLEIISAVIYFTNAFVGAIVFNRIRFRLPYDGICLTILAVNFLMFILSNPKKRLIIKTER